MEKDFSKRKTQAKNKIAKICKNLPKDRAETAKKLAERAAYMLVSLEDMEEKIETDGLLTTMQQGDYTIERAHPLLTPYNAMVKNFNSTIKQLTELSPDNSANNAGSELMRFVTKQPKAANKR